MKEIEVESLGKLPEAAEELIQHFDGHNVVAFFGAMGAGKTTLIREICAQMGVTDTVTSPTFALINQYNGEGGRPIFHFDFYRIDRPEEAFDMGYEEYFYGGDLCLVEWPEKIESLLPPDTLRVTVTATGENSRQICIEE